MGCIGVILAAGASSRFSGNKLLAMLGGRPLIRWVVEAVNSALGETYIVVGHMAEEVKKAAGRIDGVIHNPWWRLGLSTSIKAAIITLADSSCIVFVLGDMPAVRPDTIRLVAQCNRGLKAPLYKGRRGNPVACCRDVYYTALTTLRDEEGLRKLVDKVYTEYVNVDDPGVLIDVDTPDVLKLVEDLIRRRLL